MVFLVFDSNNEIKETLKDQKMTKIASDMHELISSNQYCACKTKGSGCNSIGIKRLYQDIQKSIAKAKMTKCREDPVAVSVSWFLSRKSCSMVW